MRMLLISEGSRDNLFLRGLFTELGIVNLEGKIDFFDQETDASATEKNYAETKKMAKFTDLEYTEYTYKMLVKSEGGKPSALGVFKTFIVHLKRAQIHLLLDLDNIDPRRIDDDLEKTKSKLEGTLRNRQYKVLHWENFELSESLITLKAFVAPTHQRTADKGNEASFYFTIFKKTLEKEADIEEMENKEIKNEKIAKLLKSRRGIVHHFNQLFEKTGVMDELV
jgi:hypothetical protein